MRVLALPFKAAVHPAKKIAAVIIGGCISVSVAACILPGQSVAAEPLKGSVEQFDVAKGWIPTHRLPIGEWQKKVAPHLKSGLAWSDNLLPEDGTEVNWVLIPNWLPGHWHIEKARFYSDQTGEPSVESLNREEDIFGHQHDRRGGIWHMLRSPVTNMTEGDKNYSRFVHYQQTGVNKSPQQFVLESNNMEINVSKKSGRITSVRRRHDVYAWTGISGGVEADDHVEFLDNDMHPKISGSGTVKARPQKVDPFKRVDLTEDGFNARDSFKQFLEKNGLKDLAPLD